jgi:transglutaminase-like putative cysteine protease/Tfp pilus assembly protein PilF
MMVSIRFSLLSFFLLITLYSSAQSSIDQGWKYFSTNEMEKAKQSFSEALKGPDGARAHLALSLVEAAVPIAQNEEGFNQYFEFYKKYENPQPYLLGLWSMTSGKRTEAEVEFLEMVVEREQGTLRAKALQALGHHYFSSGDFKKSQKYFAQTGAITQWSILGEFENVSESGFDKDFGGLSHPEEEHKFTNKLGVEVQWFDMKAPRYDNWVDMQYFFYASDAIIYAQNFCYSPVEQEVQFRIGVSGSLKTWVNDQLLYSKAEERNNGLDSYIFKVKLNKGYNRILIQLGESEANSCNFLLRITDEKGNNIEGLEYSTTLQDYDKNYRYQSQTIEDPVEAFFSKEIQSNPALLENYLILGQYNVYHDNVFRAKQVLQTAREQYPDCAYLIFHQLSAYAKDGNRTQVTTLIEEMKMKAPDNPLVINQLYDEASERDDLETMEELIEKIEKREGKSINYYDKSIQLAGDKDLREEMLSLIEEAYDAFPETYTFVELKYLVEKEVKQSERSGIRILRKYLEDHYTEDAIIKLAGAYLETGLYEKGIETYKQLVEHNPIATGYHSNLASFYYSIGQYKRSKSSLEECLQIAPYVGSYHETLAGTFAEIGQKDKALEAYDNAILYNPYNYEARRQRRILLGEKDVFTNFAQADVYELFEKAPPASDYPDDHSIILANDINRVMYPGGGSEEKHTLLVKVFNSDGVDYWKEYRISVYNNQDGKIEKAEVIKKNGSRLAAENDGGYVVFSNLEEGDAIHLTYRLQNYFSGQLANHFWGTHYFETFLPVYQSSLSLLVPKGTQFEYQLANGSLEPEVTTVDKFERYTWSASQKPAVKYEPYMSNLVDVGMVLHYSSFPDWDYISDWYADLAKAKAKVNFEVEETAKSLFGGKGDLSKREKAEMIYDYIVDNIRYRSVSFLQSGLVPQSASTTISAKQGDCKDVSTLFVALCETQGIDANLVLINTRYNGHQQMLLPSIDFNHCIARVELEEQDYFLELTSENLPFAVAGPSNHRVFSLDVPREASRKSNASILESENRVLNSAIRKADVSFEGDNMIVKKQSTKTGYRAASMRDTYENIGKEMQDKNMQEAINSEYPGIRLQKLEFEEGLNDNSEQISYRYDYFAPDVFTEISGLKIFTLPWADNITNPDFLASEERSYPIELWQYYKTDVEEESLTIQIPEGYELAELPKSEEVAVDNFRYKMSFKLEGDILTATRYFEMLDDIVQPENYVAFKSAMERLVKLDEQKMAFKQK